MSKDSVEYLYQKSIGRALSSVDDLCRFLDTSAVAYKYPLENQALIHELIRFPTAVATFAQWKRMGRSINRGASGTYRFTGESTKGYRADLFDVSDTCGPENTYPELWKYPPEEELRRLIGMERLPQGNAAAVQAVAARAAGALPPNSLAMGDAAAHSKLVAAATAYTMLKRLGLPAEEQKTAIASSFKAGGIGRLSIEEKVNILVAVTSLSSLQLRKIERSVKHGEYQKRERWREEKRPSEVRTAAVAQDKGAERGNLPSQRGDGDLSHGRGGADAGQVWGAISEVLTREQQREGKPSVGPGELLGEPGDVRRAIGEDVHHAERPNEEQKHRAGGLLRADGVAGPDRRGGGRAGDGGAERNDSVTSIADLSNNGIEQNSSALAYGDGLTGQPKRSGAFFMESGTAPTAMDTDAPTLDELLAKTTTVAISTVEGGTVAFTQVEETREALAELTDKHLVTPHPYFRDTRIPHDRSWMEKRLPANLLVEAAEGEDPTILAQSKKNYRFSADSGSIASGAKTRFRDNLEAIDLLRQLEADKRAATPEEQEILARYAGWGGLSEAFDAGNSAWKGEHEALRQRLTQQEYDAARASTTTSFYTPVPVIAAMYQALEQFGVPGSARILEPASGTGRFFGALPESLAHARLYGVEVDRIPVRIAQQLYPNADIRHDGFEKVQFSDNRFDVAIGNVPFGDFPLADARYDKHRFLIHDYFFAKALDKVRPGGVVAFITSAGTMDKKSANVREYLARRAELIGAIRLPNTAFRSAGAGVTTDIVFLQKREQLRNPAEPVPEWTQITDSDHGINRYYVAHPEMVLGRMELVSGRFGHTLECLPEEGGGLEERLAQAVSQLEATIPDLVEDLELGAVPAPPGVRNFTYTVREGTLYYREYDRLLPQPMKAAELGRVVGLCGIRETARELIRLQPMEGEDARIEALRGELNDRYDSFVRNYGDINSPTNTRLFRKDVDCNLVLALEARGDGGRLYKSAIFSQRTVDPRKMITHVDSAQDALAISLNERGRVDVPYMADLCRKGSREIITELGGMLFLNPAQYDPEDPDSGWETSEEYLSGNVRQKAAEARAAAKNNPELFSRNVEALDRSLPEWIEAGQIEARLGAAWIGKDYFTQFMYDTMKPPNWLRGDDARAVRIEYDGFTSRWTVYNKNDDNGVAARELFGTKRVGAYAILEDTLNLKDVEVKDRLQNGSYVLNARETQLARAKQTLMKNAFAEWVFKDADRRHALEKKYNDQFNSIRIREYDGSALTFPGLATTFCPREHQRNAVARICDKTNHTLLDHVVGAGKTATMIMGAYELNRLGLSNRAMFAVPNHIVGQFRDDIYKMYPDAKALIVSEADFEKSNRQQFLSRIIYSDIDMIVLGHTQFERIMMSPEYQQHMLEKEIAELTEAISDAKRDSGARWTVKQMEKQAAELTASLTRLQKLEKKDQLVTFEQLGVDALFVDEADLFKNCYIFSKLRNVAGIGTAKSQRAADMLLKCRYLTDHGGKIVFATGTPISNALSEMYVMQRYLQERTLHKQGIRHFDEWVSDFAETTTSLELAPEGTGFRQRTRLAKYFNLPELMQLYRQVADVQTANMLNLPKPVIKGGEPEVVVCEPSDGLVAWVGRGVDRCRAIRNRQVKPEEDNMLKFTMEARLASLDMRLVDPGAAFDPQGKLARCAEKLLDVYRETAADRGFQLVFCDSSTPHPGRFNVYAELKRLCMEMGIPGAEIAFIHDTKNSKQRDAMFQKCRSGEIRILIGSTEKCGAGTNIQDRMAALHHLDCPYRPRDIEQREGRGLRQGNRYSEIPIVRYVTERSFDSYLWNIVATKQRFIAQVRQGSSGQRVFEDKDEMLLSFETVQAVATGNPMMMEKINLDNEISRLQILQTEHRNQQYRLEDGISKHAAEMDARQTKIERIRMDIEMTNCLKSDSFRISIGETLHEKREEAGQALLALAQSIKGPGDTMTVGEYLGMKIVVYNDKFTHHNHFLLEGSNRYNGELNEASGTGTITRMENIIKALPERMARENSRMDRLRQSIQDASSQLGKGFPFEEDLANGLTRQAELNVLLSLDDKEVERSDKEPENEAVDFVVVPELQPVSVNVEYNLDDDLEI